MKLKNKKTGEIVEKYPDRFVINSGEQIRQYDSLAELNAEWEDTPEAYKEEASQTNVGSTQANDELLKNAIVITKRAHEVWDKVEKYRCKLVYGYDLGVDALNVDDIEEIDIVLQEYSGVLIEAMFNLTGKYVPHVSDYERGTD